MEISDLSKKVLAAFDSTDVDESIALLVAAFWNTTETSAELQNFAQQVSADLRAADNIPEAEFCEQLHTALLEREKSGEQIKIKWFIAEILRITGWVKIPSPTRYASEYLDRNARKAAVAAALLQALPGILAQRAARSRGRALLQRESDRRQAQRDAAGSFVRKAGLVALAPLTAGGSLLLLALED